MDCGYYMFNNLKMPQKESNLIHDGIKSTRYLALNIFHLLKKKGYVWNKEPLKYKSF